MMVELEKDKASVLNAKKIEDVAAAYQRGEVTSAQLRDVVSSDLWKIGLAKLPSRDSNPPIAEEQRFEVGGVAPSALSHPEIESLRQALRSIVGKLHEPSNDPLKDIYILGGQVIFDIRDKLPESDLERLQVFVDLANESCLICDRDPSLSGLEADGLRQRVRQAAAEYLGESQTKAR